MVSWVRLGRVGRDWVGWVWILWRLVGLSWVGLGWVGPMGVGAGQALAGDSEEVEATPEGSDKRRRGDVVRRIGRHRCT